ncbi:hypothetical protein ACTXT7_010914 [Hymenolepis weldensis]
MFESLFTDIKILSAKIATKMSPDVSNTSATTASPNSKNSAKSPGSGPMDDKCKESEEIGLAKPAAHSKGGTDSMNTYLDTCDLPPRWNHESPEIQQNHLLDYYSRRFRRSRKRFKVDPMPKRMDK